MGVSGGVERKREKGREVGKLEVENKGCWEKAKDTTQERREERKEERN